MTTLGKPLTQHLLDQLNAFNWLMGVQPAKPRPPTAVDIAHTQRDIGMTASDATGICSHQAALPFFMQAGFR